MSPPSAVGIDIGVPGCVCICMSGSTCITVVVIRGIDIPPLCVWGGGVVVIGRW